jgi:redox-sensing transcriptional repressor
MAKLDIPRKTVYRLSLYQRGLQRLKTNQIDTVSSAALAKASGVKPTQLRKDLTYFGQFGTRGLGYDVIALCKKLDEVLGTTRLQPVVLAGAGNLGMALLGYYEGFAKEGFEIVAAFDVDVGERRCIGKKKIEVRPIAQIGDFVRENHIKMAIVAVPGAAAQEVVNSLVIAGMQAILNFAPVVLQVPPHVVVNNVDLAIELENLSYFIR